MTALKWDLIQNNDKIALQLSGGAIPQHVCYHYGNNVLLFYQKSKTIKVSLNLILTEINRIDSAGFALLCDFLHDCEQLPNKKVRLINPPEQLLTLADLVNLSHWISTFIDHH